MISTNGIDLDAESLVSLEQFLQNELYIDINSPFAKELMAEIDRRIEV